MKIILFLLVVTQIYTSDLIEIQNDIATIQPEAKIQLGDIQISFGAVQEIVVLAQKMMKICGADLSICLNTEQNKLLMRDLDNFKAFEPIIPQEIKQITIPKMNFKQQPTEQKSQQQEIEEDLDQKVNSMLYG